MVISRSRKLGVSDIFDTVTRTWQVLISHLSVLEIGHQHSMHLLVKNGVKDAHQYEMVHITLMDLF